MKQIKLKLFVFEETLKDSKGKVITEDIAEMLREEGMEVVEGEELKFKDVTLAFNNLPPFILIGNQTSELTDKTFTIMQGLTEDLMFNFEETPEEIMRLINEAEDSQLSKDMSNMQLEIPFQSWTSKD
jgi:hypothetical protein